MPHSEIRGSKLILSSSRLIAEYHVLHRLLLPRHPPNALLALDLIQKKKGFHLSREPGWFDRSLASEPKAYFPAPSAGSAMLVVTSPSRDERNIEQSLRITRVSVLDLEFHILAVEPQVMAHCRDQI